VFDYQGKKAYYAVNYTHPSLGLNNRLSFTLSGGYEVYANGRKTDVEGSGEIALGVGCGAFFLPKE
jgi:hypothetical protein